MSISAIFQFAMLFLKLANWIIRKVDQAQWEASGYKKAVAEETAAINESVGIARQALKDAKAMTPEEKRKALKEPL